MAAGAVTGAKLSEVGIGGIAWILEEGRCSRCGGFMMTEPDEMRRCVQCGERIDPVILQNRELQRKAECGSEEDKMERRSP